MVDYTTTELINSIKRRGILPTNQSTFTNTLYLDYATEELLTRIVPTLISLQEEYFVAFEDTVMTADPRYPIPERAYGGKLRDIVRFVDDNTELEVHKIEPEFTREGDYANTSTNGLFYYIEGNDVVLFPDTDPGNVLRIYYYLRPNKLVRVIETGKITSIDTNTGVVTLNNTPVAWSTSNQFDVINHLPPFQTVASDQTPIAVSSPTITFSDVSELTVGNYVALRGESPIPQIPVEAHILLAQATVQACLESLSDINGAKVAENKYDRLKKTFISAVDSRTDGDPQRITSRDKLLNFIRGRNNYGNWRS